jgi:AraC-like DNA-binding protein
LSAKYLSTWKVKNKPDEYQAKKIHWLQQFLRIFMIFQAIWLIYLIPYIIPATRNWLLNTFDWYPIYIPLAVLIYWLGIKGYIASITFRRSGKKTAPLQDQFTPAMIEETVQLLQQAMEQDKLYLNPLLNLDALAQHTNLPAKRISAVLNQHLQKSFNEYINVYRVEEFKIKIMQEDLNHLTITGVALQCGFNSPATFQRTFKQMTGMSPSGFRKNI